MPMNLMNTPTPAPSLGGFDIGKILGGALPGRGPEAFGGGGGGITPALLFALLFGGGLGALTQKAASPAAPAAPEGPAPEGNLYARKMQEMIGRTGQPATSTTTVSQPGEVDLSPFLQMFMLQNWSKMMGQPGK